MRRSNPFAPAPPPKEGRGGGSSPEINHPRALRRRQTDAEALLWRRLRKSQLGLRFRRQHPIAGYIVDFYCHDARLAVEVDGGGHAALDQSRYDRVRTELLECIGVKLLRFWNNEVLENLDGVLTTILNEVHLRR